MNDLLARFFAEDNMRQIPENTPVAGRLPENYSDYARGASDHYLTGVTAPFMKLAEFFADDGGYTPGELKSSQRDKLRGDRFAWDDYLAANDASSPSYNQGGAQGEVAQMVFDPVYDLPLMGAAKIAPVLSRLDNLEGLGRILKSQRGAVGDTVYHGTDAAFDKFLKSKQGESTGAKSAKAGTWVVSSPETASGYAHYKARNSPIERLVDKANKAGDAGDWDAYDALISKAEALEADINENIWRGQNIRPVKYDGDFKTVDMQNAEFTDEQDRINSIILQAKRDKKDGVIFENLADDPGFNGRPSEHTIIFDPKNIKSVYEQNPIALDDFIVRHDTGENLSYNGGMKTSFEQSPTGKLYGYKVMPVDGDKLRSGANSRIVLPMERGATHEMPGNGIFMSNNPDYVKNYYSGLADNEVLIKYEFDPDDLISGNLTDREPEIGVKRGRVVDIEHL